ncbi:MAG: UDP-glucose 4-epimerase GalE [Candidatus Berkiella sp.]
MTASSILITGGAGYVGSHVVKALLATPQRRVIVVDNLSTGHLENIPSVPFVKASIHDKETLTNIIRTENVNAVMHFAASTVISESIEHPLDYYTNNTMGTLHLLEVCAANKIQRFIFSSTAAVYGPSDNNIDENSPLVPTNPYGESKVMSEQILKDVAKTGALTYVILRYFNVAGADMTGTIGQRGENATHLLKVAVETACGLRASLPIYGTDYATPDGTAIRDFIHVDDLAAAHIDALTYLENKGESITLNCGYGKGYSVKEVISALEKVIGRTLPCINEPRRAGDIARVVADNTLIKQTLNWQPQYDDITTMVRSAYEWEKKLWR